MFLPSERVLSSHAQKYPGSGATSLAELLFQLNGVAPPDFQSCEAEGPTGLGHLYGQVHGAMMLRHFQWHRPLVDFVREELLARRPIGLLLRDHGCSPRAHEIRSWLAVSVNPAGPFLFADLVGKAPERGGGEGRFSERRVVLLNDLGPEVVEDVLYCEFVRSPARVLQSA